MHLILDSLLGSRLVIPQRTLKDTFIGRCGSRCDSHLLLFEIDFIQGLGGCGVRLSGLPMRHVRCKNKMSYWSILLFDGFVQYKDCCIRCYQFHFRYQIKPVGNTDSLRDPIDTGWWPWSANHSSVLENTTTNRKPQTGKHICKQTRNTKTEPQTGKQNHKQENRTTNRKTQPQTGKHKQDNISANKHNRTRNSKRSHKQETTNRKSQTGNNKQENTTANPKIVVLWFAVVFSSVLLWFALQGHFKLEVRIHSEPVVDRWQILCLEAQTED